MTVTPERLDGHLRAMRRQGLRGMSMRDLLATGGRGMGLTFDDGYADFLDEALPVLRRHGATATLYVLAGRLGGENAWDPEGPRKKLMTAEQVRTAAAAGMEIGSHGMLHRCLPELTAAELREETVESRVRLAEVTGAPVEGLAYPFGEVGDREIVAARAAGYDHAVAVALPAGVSACRHALPRAYAGQRDGDLRLFAKRLRQRLRERR
ncbi:polysaccharide deacetylase family protein [Actinomycetospora sp. NBRC 106375]|uniref:polysaccharide deacetylase family protein n=1 Tax=Actinomycetospora sp. NBRC 106375 TaxID=3032207 RepID=UPI002555EC7E|nr:polysaccharide deacetylase family protein [Actinomycetospora sp. NBRC 106375]